MRINSVELVISAVRRSQYPTDNKPEYLLVGRSNVGKSSFINTLINRKNYARTSATPGKTQTINFYLVNNDFYLVDAPGYGFAMLSKKKQKKFGLMMEDYIQNRPNLKQVFMLVDFRHKPTNDDLLMYNYIISSKKPCLILANKADKIAPTKVMDTVNNLQKIINPIGDIPMLPFSSERKIYSESVWKEIKMAI